jgi:hypothetical protein
MNFVGYFSKTFWVFYGCFRWVLFYQVGGFLVGLWDDWKNPIFAQLVISLNLILAGLRLGLPA